MFIFFLMIRRPPRATRMTHSFPTRRSSDLATHLPWAARMSGNRVLEALSMSGSMRRVPQRNGPFSEAFSPPDGRSEEHTSELQSLMRISYAVFCLKQKKILPNHERKTHTHNTSPKLRQHTNLDNTTQ